MQNGIMLLTEQYGIVCSNMAECGMPQHSMSQHGVTQYITGHNCAIIESFDREANKTEYYSCYG